jgi:hypothetical protein
VVAESILAFLMSKSASPDAASFDNTTDSLEALSDKINAVDDYIDTEVAAIQADIGDPSSRANFQSLMAMVGIPDAANSCVDDILRTGFDSSAIAANADGSVMEREEAIKDQISAFAAGGGDGSAIARKTVTFANTDADVNLFNVTGGISYKLFAFCTTNVESAAGCNIGVDHNGAVVIADTDCTTLEANDVWHDATPDASLELESVAGKRVAYGGTIAIDVEGAKQVDSGVIVFVCVYTPLTSDGAVAAV